jgi:hypothetical protein
MSRERKPVQLQPGTFTVLMSLRERIFELEGRRLTVDETVQVALAGMTEAPLPPSYEEQLKRTLVSVIGQLLVRVRPDLAAKFRGVAFNSSTGMAVVDLEGDDDPLQIMARDPAGMVSNS